MFNSHYDRCSYKDFTILIDPKAFGATRDEVYQKLAGQGIATRRYYYPLVHRIKACRPWAGLQGSLPVTDRVSMTALSLPLAMLYLRSGWPLRCLWIVIQLSLCFGLVVLVRVIEGHLRRIP